MRSDVALVVAAAFMVGCSGPATTQTARVEYDAQTGRLRRIEFDVNGNGHNDAVSVMDGTRLHHVELDLDENGHTDRWDFYAADNKLDRVGFSRRNDGLMDAQAFYGADGALLRIEISTHRDRRFDRIEFYERGVLVRSQEDTNGDGRADKWEAYRSILDPPPGEPAYAITSVAFDYEGRGIPQRRFIFANTGQVDRVEVDPDGDGLFVLDDRANNHGHATATR